MTFRVIGADRQTGLDCEMAIDAGTERDAIAIAGQRMVISHIKALHAAPTTAPLFVDGPATPPPVPVVPINYAVMPKALRPARWWVQPVIVASAVLSILFIGVIIAGSTAQVTSTATSAAGGTPRPADVLAERARQEAVRRAALKKQFDALGGAPMLRPTEGMQLGEVGRLPPNCQILQITGPTTMIVNTNERCYIVRGVSTAGRIDDTALRVDGPFIVAGTETYGTAAGASRTVFFVEPLQ
jgi:hypothetical protein